MGYGRPSDLGLPFVHIIFIKYLKVKGSDFTSFLNLSTADVTIIPVDCPQFPLKIHPHLHKSKPTGQHSPNLESLSHRKTERYKSVCP